jgi:hypothetical protein
MTFFPGNRKHLWSALAAIFLAGWHGLACFAPSANLVFPPAPAQCVWEGIERVVAVGDLHGDYEAFVTILQDRKLIDKDEKWIGGRAHLVQIGDVVDRGDKAREIYMLLSRLEQEAAAAGGMVHFLPGNHEEMNLARVSMEYVGYVSLEQFKSFLHGAYLAPHDRLAARMSPEDADQYWKTLMDQRGARDAYYDGFRDAVGAWIIGHDVIIKINGVVFVHGGISIEDSRRSLESINAKYREEFIEAMTDNQRPFQFVFQPSAPLWYRDFAGGNGSSVTESDIKQILSNLKANKIVVGHSPTPYDTAERFGGLVWIIDSFISEKYEDLVGFSQLSSLDIDKDGIPKLNKGEIRYGKKKNPGVALYPGNPGGLRMQFRPLSAAGHA